MSEGEGEKGRKGKRSDQHPKYVKDPSPVNSTWEQMEKETSRHLRVNVSERVLTQCHTTGLRANSERERACVWVSLGIFLIRVRVSTLTRYTHSRCERLPAATATAGGNDSLTLTHNSFIRQKTTTTAAAAAHLQQGIKRKILIKERERDARQRRSRQECVSCSDLMLSERRREREQESKSVEGGDRSKSERRQRS